MQSACRLLQIARAEQQLVKYPSFKRNLLMHLFLRRTADINSFTTLPTLLLNGSNWTRFVNYYSRHLKKKTSDYSSAKQEYKWLHKDTTSNSPSKKSLKQILISDRFLRLKPLAYCMGTEPFLNLEIVVRRPILIPRRETEFWVGNLIEMLKKSRPVKNILEVGVGSGCISLAMAKNLSCQSILGIDVNPHALKLANLNLSLQKSLKTPTVNFKLLDVFDSDIVDKLNINKYPSKFSLIVSNPPYIPRSHEGTLVAVSVARWETPSALYTIDKDGIAFHVRMAELLVHLLDDLEDESALFKPRLVMEIGGNYQVDPLKKAFASILPPDAFLTSFHQTAEKSTEIGEARYVIIWQIRTLKPPPNLPVNL